MVDYAQLLALNTSKLSSAATASAEFGKAMVDRGEEVRTSANIPEGMWSGADAAAARGLLAGMPEPLYSVSDSANSGKKTLDDLVTELNKAKEHLGGAQDAIKGTGIDINPATGVVTTPVVTDPGLAAENDRKAQDARNIIDEALRMANDADAKAANDLNSLAGTTQAAYMEIPGKQADLNKARDLIRTPEQAITPEKARELSEILKRNNNPEFNRQLMEQLGPKELIDGSGRYSEKGANLAHAGDDAGADAFRDVQQRLGESLASASPQLAKDANWMGGLREAGANPVGDTDHKGYEALAPLLEHGTYDKEFLVPVAEHMTRLDKAGEFETLGLSGDESGTKIEDNPYIITKGPSGSPLNSVMAALDHNPEAATDYFTGTNDEPGAPLYLDEDNKALSATGDSAKNPNIDYVLDHAEKNFWTGPPSLNQDLVGNALEAAATGVPAGSGEEVARPARTEDMVHVAEHLVNRFGAGDGEMDLVPGGKLEDMADNMTNVATTYMPEIHNSFLNPNSEDAILHPNGAMAEFKDEDAVASMLHALGRHEESFHQLLGASNGVQDAMLAQEFQDNDGKHGSWVQEALAPGSTTANILTDAQVEAGVQAAADSDQSTNNMIQAAVSGAKIATSGIPFGGALIGEILDPIKNDVRVDSTEQALYDGNVERTDVYDAQLARERVLIERLVYQDGPVPTADEETLLRYVDGDINNAWSAGENEVESRKTDGRLENLGGN